MFSNVDTLNVEKMQEIRVILDSMEIKLSIIAIKALSETKPKTFKYERVHVEYHLDGNVILHMGNRPW